MHTKNILHRLIPSHKISLFFSFLNVLPVVLITFLFSRIIFVLSTVPVNKNAGIFDFHFVIKEITVGSSRLTCVADCILFSCRNPVIQTLLPIFHGTLTLLSHRHSRFHSVIIKSLLALCGNYEKSKTITEIRRVTDRHVGWWVGQTPALHCQYIAPSVCLLPSFRWYSLRLPTEDGQAELTWRADYIPRWFILLQTVAHLGTNRARRRVTALIETKHLDDTDRRLLNCIYFLCDMALTGNDN